MKIDIIYITPVPSFYKINQLNALSESMNIIVIYTGGISETRNNDFFSNEEKFSSYILKGGTIKKIIQFLNLMRRIKYEQLIISGWNSIIVLLSAFLFPKKKNSCVVESSIYELKTDRKFKTLIKKLFLHRISIVYASGVAQGKLVRTLGFKNEIKYTGGCGILNYVDQPQYEPRNIVKTFLYVGRLSSEKNLVLLIETFNKLPRLILQVIGYGPQEVELRTIAHENIHFLGAVNNKELWLYYRNADVFILPSKSEPWGLVIEEALNNGTPVIVSNRVGCKDDLVTDLTGLVFDLENEFSLQKNILKITDVEYYNSLRKGVSLMNFNERAKKQVDVFLK